jgi:subtilase family serine protease
MRNWFARRRWTMLLATCVLAAGVVAVLAAMPGRVPVAAAASCPTLGATGDRVTLPGNVPPILQGRIPTGMVACSRVMSLTISLRMRDPNGLNHFLAEVYDPKSPLYHHFLSPQQIADQFGQTLATIQAIEGFVDGQGFKVTDVSVSRTGIKVTATVGQIEQALGVKLAYFTISGHTVIGPLGDPSVPSAIAPAIAAIVGLDTVSVAHPVP